MFAILTVNSKLTTGGNVISVLIIAVCIQFLALLWLGKMLSSQSRSLRMIQVSLDDARQVKTDFLSNVSHEIRTPMAGIKGHVDNMLDGIAGEITEKHARYLARVKVNAGRPH